MDVKTLMLDWLHTYAQMVKLRVLSRIGKSLSSNFHFSFMWNICQPAEVVSSLDHISKGFKMIARELCLSNI